MADQETEVVVLNHYGQIIAHFPDEASIPDEVEDDYGTVFQVEPNMLRTVPKAPVPPHAAGEEDWTYPCDDCGVMRTKAEGGKVFTVCDVCWDKHYSKPPAASQAVPEMPEWVPPFVDLARKDVATASSYLHGYAGTIVWLVDDRQQLLDRVAELEREVRALKNERGFDILKYDTLQDSYDNLQASAAQETQALQEARLQILNHTADLAYLRGKVQVYEEGLSHAR